MPPRNTNQNYNENEHRRDILSPASNPWIIPLSIIIAGVCIGAGVYFSLKGSVGGLAGTTPAPVIGDINVSPVIASDHILGDPNAPVKIIEFSDTECPFCKEFHQTMQSIMDTYGKTGQVAWVFRHFPIDQLHKRAHREAVATECANEQGGNAKFWAYLDAVFNRTSSNDRLDPSELPKIAQDIGLDVGKFNDCLGTTRYDALILRNSQDATRVGVTGTPFSVMVTSDGNKVGIKGAQPYSVVKALIDIAINPNSPTKNTSADTSTTP